MVDEEAVEGEGRGGSGAKILRGKGALALYLSETTKSKDSPQVRYLLAYHKVIK